jgi:hypothetical protein
MSNHEQKPKLVGPWRNLHAAVWLIGLAILAWKGWWWPGILVLVAISLVIEAVLMRYAPQAFAKPEQTQPAQPTPTASPVPAPPVASAPPVAEHPFDRLPSVCAKCGGPIRGHEVKWTGPQSADCPYCGANIQMERR